MKLSKCLLELGFCGDGFLDNLYDWASLHSQKLTWKPQKGPIKTTVLLQGDYMGVHVSLGECINVTGPPDTLVR